jgi:uncharacterized protein YhjY with autotransporter beta-barrel domain
LITVLSNPPIVSTNTVVVLANSSANAVTPTISGSATSIKISSGPSHGSAIVNGLNVSYTPTTEYVGDDSFSVIATGPGGTSSPATITVTVRPIAPVVSASSVSVQANSMSNTIIPTITGSASSLAISAAPSHGIATVNGMNISYTPNPAYFGGDAMSVTATGPGGPSIVANITINVLAIAPTVNATSANVQANSAGNTITPSILGNATSLSISAVPSHGVAIVNGLNISYTPTAGYAGLDTIAVVANGPGGASAAALISITVISTAPIIKTTTAQVQSSGGGSLISPTIAGVVTGLQITVQPTHGTATVVGLDIRYMPTAGFVGTDMISVAAVGPDGTSAPTLITITVVAAPPVVSGSSISVMLNSNANPIALGIVGVISTINLNTSPAHGVATINGQALVYTPTPGYVGTDSIVITATGPGGTSAPATISVTVVATPPGLTASSASVLANSSANKITLNLTGVVTSLAIANAPTHGVAVVSGLVLSYTPTPGFVGSDAILVSAIGPGGTSVATTISISVLAMPAASATLVVQANSAANLIPTANNAGANASSLSLNNVPLHGTVTISGLTLSYTPTTNYVGSDTFSYSINSASGSFASANVLISVVAAAPSVSSANLSVVSGTSGSIDLANTISGPIFTGVTISVSSAPTHGIAVLNGTKLTYTPEKGFVGVDILRFIATAIGGSSKAAELSITVTGRPDPARDASVVALQALSTATVRHFEQAQIENFNGRLSEVASQASAAAADDKKKANQECGQVSMWAAGLNSFGSYRGANGFKYTTMGYSAGGDRCFSGGKTVVGFGVGYGRDHSELASNGSAMTATATTAASYMTMQLLPFVRFSMMAGVNKIDDHYDRFDQNSNVLVQGQWKGNQLLSSSSVSNEFKFGTIIVVPFGRVDISKLSLDPYSETGNSSYLLHYHQQTMMTQKSTVGFTSEMTIETPMGQLIPRLRVEYQRDFARRDSLKVNYADNLAETVYVIPANELDRKIMLMQLGADMTWKSGIVTIFNYSYSSGNFGNKINRLQVRFSYKF